MKIIYSAPILAMVQNVKNVLELHGIPTTIRNEYLSAGTGELPPSETWPQLWVADEDAERALEILQSAEEDLSGSRETWVCPECKEEMEGQFTVCWNCGTARDKE